MKSNKDPKNTGFESASSEWKPGLVAAALQEEFVRFIDYHSAARLSRNLRKMLLEFLMYDGALEAIYLRELLYDMVGLFDLLDAIESAKGPGDEE